ncbi:hypothetical protein ABI_13140 [Asticcacaulis biprosthecium C19]|uniref:Uncharacterized protein n=1 Tax=Asticcacaulis biprosthecium C19 TaxID=715226 RepID=F4QI09_9CAUL|nr:hypothetical protein ABI_13140 [Asticcacaulis biprosthecium C19]
MPFTLLYDLSASSPQQRYQVWQEPPTNHMYQRKPLPNHHFFERKKAIYHQLQPELLMNHCYCKKLFFYPSAPCIQRQL